MQAWILGHEIHTGVYRRSHQSLIQAEPDNVFRPQNQIQLVQVDPDDLEQFYHLPSAN